MISTTFNTTTDALIFEEGERQLGEDLQLKFEAVQQMKNEDQQTVKSSLEGMILKHQAKQMLGIKNRATKEIQSTITISGFDITVIW